MLLIERPFRALASASIAGSRPSMVLDVTITVSVTCEAGRNGGIELERAVSVGVDTLVGSVGGVTVEAG